MKKIIALFVVVLLFFLVLLGFSLPFLLSTSQGKAQFVDFINKEIPGKVVLKKLSLSWYGTQKIEGLSVYDEEGSSILSLETLDIQSSLLSLIWNRSCALKVTFKNLEGVLVSDNLGNTNLMRAFGEITPSTSIFTDDITQLTALFKNVQGEFDLSPSSTFFKIKMSGDTEQKSIQGQFNIHAELKGISLQNLLKEEDKALWLNTHKNIDLNIQASLLHFPVELLDQIVSMKQPAYQGLLLELLGDELNLNITQKTIPNEVLIDVVAQSKNLSTTANFSLAQALTLLKSSDIAFKISPQLFEKYTKINNLCFCQLVEPLKALITIHSLQVPFGDFDLNTITFDTNISIGPGEFLNTLNQSNLKLKTLNTTLRSVSGSPDLICTMQGDSVSNQQLSHMDIDLKLPKLAFLNDFSINFFKNIDLRCQILAFPIFLLDNPFIPSEPLSLFLGTKGDISLSIEEIGDKPMASIQFKSDKLEISKASFVIDESITLQKPLDITLNLPSSIINRALKELEPRVQNPVTLNLAIKRFACPASFVLSTKGWPMDALYSLLLESEFSSTPIQLLSNSLWDRSIIDNILFKVSMAPNSQRDLTLQATLTTPGNGKLFDLLGKKTTLNTEASFGLGFNGKLTPNIFNTRLVSNKGRLDVSGELIEGNRLVLNAPALLSYTFDSAVLQTLGIHTESLVFTQQEPLYLTIENSHIPLDFEDFSLLRLSGILKIKHLQFINQISKQYPKATLENLIAKWHIDAGAQKIALDFSGITRLNDREGAGKLQGNVAINDWLNNGLPDFSHATLFMNTKANNLPTQLFCSFLACDKLLPLIGHSIDIHMAANTSLNNDSKAIIEINLKSDNILGSMALSLSDQQEIITSSPAEFQLNLSPQGYAAFREWNNFNSTIDFRLQETAILNFKIKSMRIPYKTSLSQSSFDCYFNIDKLVGLDQKSSNKLMLKNIRGDISSPNIQEHIDFKISLNGIQPTDDLVLGSITGAIKKGFNVDGTLNKKTLSLDLEANFESLPLSLMCEFACSDNKFKKNVEALIGPSLNCKIKAKLQNMNGPFNVSLKGKNGNVSIDARLKEGFLFLNQNLTAELRVTPLLNKQILSEFFPIISGMLSADHPLKLIIGADGFLMPLNNIFEKTLSFKTASLEIGKVRFSKESPLSNVFSLLSSVDNDHLLVWLTPIYFSLKEGKLTLERVDMLVSDKYPLAAWGNVDFNKDKVNMIIALSGAAIDKAFGVSGIPRNSFLQIPLKGKLNSPTIDKARAVTRITALVAQSQGNAQGLVIGTVLDIASGKLTEEAPPPPTTQPLPWVNEFKDDNLNTTEQEGLGEKILSPIKEIGKGASLFLKELLK